MRNDGGQDHDGGEENKHHQKKKHRSQFKNARAHKKPERSVKLLGWKAKLTAEITTSRREWRSLFERQKKKPKGGRCPKGENEESRKSLSFKGTEVIAIEREIHPGGRTRLQKGDQKEKASKGGHEQMICFQNPEKEKDVRQKELREVSQRILK